MWARTISKIKLFCSHSVIPSELQPGDHIYVWRNVKHLFMYQHHGVYIGNGKCIHFTTRQNDADFEAQMRGTTTPDQKNQEVIITNNTLKYNKTNSSYEVVKKEQETMNSSEQPPSFFQKIMKKLDPNSKANKAVIIETSLDYFIYGGKLKKARYSVSGIEYFCKAGGTCYKEKRIEGAETVQKAMKYAQAYQIDNNNQNPNTTAKTTPMLKEIYSLSQNNCEHIVLEWTTGQRRSYQAYRLFRRATLTVGLCGLSFYKVSENHILEATEKYAKLIVIYEHILNYWIYFATFIL